MPRPPPSFPAAAAQLLVVLAPLACSRSSPLRMATTTSVEASGLLDRLLPRVREDLGIRVDAVAVGSGKALRILERGDADLALTHDPEGEQQLAGRGLVERRPLMWNDFVILGPPADPARVRGGSDAVAALRRLASGATPFVSRGDDSGTHRAERRLWRAAGVRPAGAWYRETGQGQGQTLQVAHEVGGYTFSDRSTFATYRGRLDLAVMVEGDPRLRNVYSLLLPRRLADVQRANAQAFWGWLESAPARAEMRALRFEPLP